VGQLLADGPDLTSGVTRLIGENGSGESFLAREDGQVVVATHSPARGAAGGFWSGAGTWATRHLLD
jgi:hypothetical protein